jgi:hypothetical protein
VCNVNVVRCDLERDELSVNNIMLTVLCLQKFWSTCIITMCLSFKQDNQDS